MLAISSSNHRQRSGGNLADGHTIPGSGLLLTTWQTPTLGFRKQERQLRTGSTGGCLRSIAQALVVVHAHIGFGMSKKQQTTSRALCCSEAVCVASAVTAYYNNSLVLVNRLRLTRMDQSTDQLRVTLNNASD